MTKSNYKFLVFLSLLTGIAAGAVDHVFPALLPEGASDVIEQAADSESPTWEIATLAFLGLGVLVAGLAGTYGLYRLRPWAPQVALLSTVGAVVFSVLMGPSVVSGVSTALGYVSSSLWGAVLILPFVGEYRAWFSAGPATPPQHGGDDWPTHPDQ